MRIFLTGMPGSGKSYWMQQLAQQLHYRSVDMDHFIEAREQASIALLFSKGEAYFREKERAALLAIIEQYTGKVIIATGGGAPCYKDNLQLMKDNGCVIYLESTQETLLANIAQQHIERPLLRNDSAEDLAGKLSELYRKRKEIYEQAHVKMDTSKAGLSTFVQAIEQYLSDHNLPL